MALGIDVDIVAALQPAGDGLAQRRQPGRRGITAGRRNGRNERLADESRGVVLGIADAKVDKFHPWQRLLARAQLGEGVRLELDDRGVH